MDENQNPLQSKPDILEPDKTIRVKAGKKTISPKLCSLLSAAAKSRRLKEKETTEIIKPLDTSSQGLSYYIGSSSTAFRKLDHAKCLRMNTNPALFIEEPINSPGPYKSIQEVNYYSHQHVNVVHLGPKPNKKSNKIILFPLLVQHNSGDLGQNGTAGDQNFTQSSQSNSNSASTDQTATGGHSRRGTDNNSTASCFDSNSRPRESTETGSISRSENETSTSISESEYETDTSIADSEDLDGDIPSITVIMEQIDKIHQKRLADYGQDPIDQTALVDAVGRANCKNRGYRTRDPGPYLMTRNASEIKFEHIKNLGTVDPGQLKKYIAILQSLGILIMIVGMILFLFIFGLSFNLTIAEYFRESVANHLLTMVILLAGIFQPIIIGMYSIMALSQLDHLRPYFLRVPFTFVIPLMLLRYGAKYINSTHEALEVYLQLQIDSYKINGFSDVRGVWDVIQTTLSCCGINSSLDWKSHLNFTGQAAIPKSCCINQDDFGCPNFAPISAFFPDGCLRQLQNFNLGIGIGICVTVGIYLLLEITAVVLMNRLYNLVKHEIDDPRSNSKIILGQFFSICDVEYDEEEELAEAGELEYSHFIRPLPEEALNDHEK